MTAIACRDGIIAADTSSWSGDINRGGARKIFRLHDGSLFAAAGWIPVIMDAAAWLDGAAPKPTRKVDDGHLDGVLLRPDGVIYNVSSEWDVYPSTSPFDAAGSPHDFLMGAMYAGAGAEEAVRLAVEHCAKAAGDVLVERLNQ